MPPYIPAVGYESPLALLNRSLDIYVDVFEVL